MLGDKGGVAVRLHQQYSPCLIAFHCPAHRLQLAIQDIADKGIHFHMLNLFQDEYKVT